MFNKKFLGLKRVCITWPNIRRGKPSMLNSCPVALACKRELRLRGKDTIEVDDEAIDVRKDGVLYTMVTPVKAGKFMRKFDTEDFPKRHAKPFCFKLKLKKFEG